MTRPGAIVGADQGSGDGAFDLSMAVSQLASNSTDARLMLKLLVSQLADALGDRMVVERAGGRFRKSDEIKSVRVTLGNDTLEASVEGPSVRCTIGHSSGGIRIRSEQVDINTWLTRLLSTLQSEAATSEQTRAALENIVIGGPRDRPDARGRARGGRPPQGRRPPPRGARARPLHLRPLGQRVPAREGGRLPPARLRDGLVDLPHRAADPEVGREPGAVQADRGDVHRPGARHDPHGGGGHRARRRRRRGRAARCQLLRVGQRLGRVHRLRHRGQGRGRQVVPQRAGQAVHLRPVRSGLLDADADGPHAPGPRHGHVRLPHRAPQADPGARLHGPERRATELHAGALRGTRARHDAHAGRGQPLKASGIVGVRLEEKSHQWGSHTIEFLALGTAVTKGTGEVTLPKPTTIISLDN